MAKVSLILLLSAQYPINIPYLGRPYHVPSTSLVHPNHPKWTFWNHVEAFVPVHHLPIIVTKWKQNRVLPIEKVLSTMPPALINTDRANVLIHNTSCRWGKRNRYNGWFLEIHRRRAMANGSVTKWVGRRCPFSCWIYRNSTNYYKNY